MTAHELRFVNAIIGFCSGGLGGTWPTPLAALGYVACGYEREIKTILDNRDRTVTVDLICASGPSQHAICVEVKSATLDVDQARRYASIRPDELLNLGGLPASIIPNQLSHDVIYVAERAKVTALIEEFSLVQVRFPVVAGDSNQFSLVSGKACNAGLDKVFREGVTVDSNAWPLHFIPFRSDSADAAIVPHVASALAWLIIRGRNFSISDLVKRAVPHWEICGTKEQLTLKRRITDLINHAAREELEHYIERPGSAPAWLTKRGALSHPQQLGRLKQLIDRFVERTQAGIPFVEGQLDFGSAFFDPPYDADDSEDF